MRKKNTRMDWHMLRMYQTYFIVVMLGLVAGGIYAVAVRDEQSLWLMVNQYMMQGEWASGIEVIKNAFLLYARNLLLIWLCGIWRLTNPIALGVLFFVSFSYGFAVGGFVLLYGLKGILVGGLLLGIQSTLLLWIYMNAMRYGKRFSGQESRMGFKKYSEVLGVALVLVGIITLVDGYIQPLLVWIVRQIV
ncbi:MAG: hypothetical protein ACRCW2_16835 [Cellulosilyticaceae bacterium]